MREIRNDDTIQPKGKHSTHIDEPREEGGNMRHKLVDILVIVLAGIMCGCEQWIKIEDFARNKESWLREDGVTLGQLRTQEKSNEITAIPELLESLEIRGASVTIDAMGCQTEIARKIVDLQANYVLAVKRNQPSLAAGCPVF